MLWGGCSFKKNLKLSPTNQKKKRNIVNIDLKGNSIMSNLRHLEVLYSVSHTAMRKLVTKPCLTELWFLKKLSL